MNAICGIYCIENMINHKKYVGQSIDIYTRWKDHKRKLNGGKHRNKYLQHAWDKYKENNFSFYILIQCEVDFLDELEVYYIDLFNCDNNKNGYNIEPGGNSNKHLKKETRDKIAQSAKGTHCGKDNPRAISVYCPQLDRTFDCMSDAEKEGIACASNIRAYLNGRAKYAGKHPITGEYLTWEEIPKNKPFCDRKNKINKYGAIYCIELDMVFSGGPSQADRENIACRSGIERCLRGERASAGKHPITGEKLHWKQIENVNI